MGGALPGPFGRHELGESIVTIGRRASNTIVLQDTQASSLREQNTWEIALFAFPTGQQCITITPGQQ